MDTVSISLETLFDAFVEETNVNSLTLHYADIERLVDGEDKYYDLYVNNRMACADGEMCDIVYILDNTVCLRSVDSDIAFKLTKQEFEIASFN